MSCFLFFRIIGLAITIIEARSSANSATDYNKVIGLS